MKTPGSRQLLLTAAVVLLAANVGLSRVYLPKRAQIGAATLRLDALEAHNQGVRAVEASGAIAEAEGALLALRREVSAYAARQPSEEELPALIDAIAGVAQTNGVILSEIYPSVAVTHGTSNQRQINLTVAGGFHRIVAFLAGVAELPWMIAATVVDLTLDPASDSATQSTRKSGAPQLQAKLVLTTPLRPVGEPYPTRTLPSERRIAIDDGATLSDPFRSPIHEEGWAVRPEVLNLVGVIRGGRANEAIAVLGRLDGARPLRLRVGDQVGGLRVQAIEDDRIIVSFDDFGTARIVTLELGREAEETAT